MAATAITMRGQYASHFWWEVSCEVCSPKFVSVEIGIEAIPPMRWAPGFQLRRKVVATGVKTTRELRTSATKHGAKAGCQETSTPAKGEVFSLDIPFCRTRLPLRCELPDRSVEASAGARCAVHLSTHIQLQIPEIIAGEVDQMLVVLQPNDAARVISPKAK